MTRLTMYEAYWTIKYLRIIYIYIKDNNVYICTIYSGLLNLLLTHIFDQILLLQN